MALALDRDSVVDFIARVQTVDGIDWAVVASEADAATKYLNAPKAVRPSLRARALEDRWYAALDAGGPPDYTVYDDDAYFGELWACWRKYARAYLKRITSDDLAPGGICGDLAPLRTIVDLGCGLGYSSAVLHDVCAARVVATNLRDTKQWRVVETLARAFDFELVADVHEIASPVDLVFASEYFEHIDAPVAHLRDVVQTLRPRALLIANTFTAPSIGHFATYRVHGVELDGRRTSRAFARELARLGYRQAPTRLWNARPAYWKLDPRARRRAALSGARRRPGTLPKNEPGARKRVRAPGQMSVRRRV